MKFFKQKLKGFGLAELVLAIGIFAIISSLLLLLVVDGTRALQNSRIRTRAAHVIEEINSTLLMIKSESWYSVAKYTGEGIKHFEYANGEYSIVDGAGVLSGLTYSFTVQEAQRDTNDILVESGGTVDPHTRLISLSLEWSDYLGKLHTMNPIIFLNDWDTNSVIYTTKEDFLLGTHDGTIAVDINGGEARLQSMFYADWCNPSISMSIHDLPGQGIASTISTNNGAVYMGTGFNASGVSFMKATVVGEPPVVTDEGSFDGYKVNDIFGIDNHALLSTDTNFKEVVIIDVSTLPYTEVGYFDAAGNADGDAIYAYNGKGFVGHGSTLSIFNLTSYTGSRALINSVNVGGIITDIFVDDTYVYLTLSGSTNDFVIYEYSPTLTLKGYVNLGSLNATSLFISEDTNRAYVGAASNSAREFFIINTTNKVGAYPVIGSYETGLLSVLGVAAVDGRAILVGNGGEEYSVLDIKDELNPIRCGGLNVDDGINDLTLVKDGSNYYTYIVTRDTRSEFRIIRGGPGGGGEDGNGYLPEGTYTSPIFDSESDTSEYYIMSLTSVIPTGTSLQLQLRTSNNSDMTGGSWVGPDGTATTYFDISDVYELPTSLSGRYFQYKASFTSDTVSTPLIEEIIINYEK